MSRIETFYANAEKDFQEGLTETEFDEDYESLSMQVKFEIDLFKLFLLIYINFLRYINYYKLESAPKKRRSEELLQELHEKKERFMRDVQSKLRDSLPGPRQVSQLLKVRVCDENVSAILSVWSPSEEVVGVLKEGARVSLYNVVASGKRYYFLTKQE